LLARGIRGAGIILAFHRSPGWR